MLATLQVTSKSGSRTLSSIQRSAYSFSTAHAPLHGSEKKLSSLKKLLRPFYMKCHPDIQLSDVSKRVNLEAIQTLNGYMDVVGATFDGRLVDWPNNLQVEFMVVKQEITANKKKPPETLSRRNVQLLVPPKSIRDTILSAKGKEKQIAVNMLLTQTQRQFLKLLKVAGIEAPVEPQKEILNETAQTHDMWDEIVETEILGDASPNANANTSPHSTNRPKTAYERSRDRFTKSINKEKFEQMYQDALRDSEAYTLMKGKVTNHKKMRQEFVNQIVSKIRVDKDATIEILDQLITLRRLTLIFEDNFEELQMEDLGKMWEDMTIILTAVRDFGTSQSALQRRRRRGQESGFSFTYLTDNRVVVHIPIDANDEEILKELSTNIAEWSDIVGDGMEKLFQPS